MSRRSFPLCRPGLVAAACLGVLLGPIAAAPSADGAQAAKRRTGPAKQALAAIERRQFVRARRAIRQIRDPFDRDAVRFAYYRREGNPARAAEIIEFLEEHPDWPLQRTLEQRVEVALRGRVSDARMLAWFARRPPTTPIGCIRHIDLLRKRGDRRAVDGEIARCWLGLPAGTAGEKKFFRRYGRRISHADRAARVRMHLDRGRYRSAYRLILFFKLSSGYAIPLRARIDLQRRPRPWTVPKSLKRIARVPAANRSEPGFRLDLVRWNRRRGNLQAASAGLISAPEPAERTAGRWWLERTLAVRELLKERHYARAYTVAASHRHTSGYRFAGAESLAGWIALRKQGEPETALKHFQRLHSGSLRRDIRAMSAWWIGETSRNKLRPGRSRNLVSESGPGSLRAARSVVTDAAQGAEPGLAPGYRGSAAIAGRIRPRSSRPLDAFLPPATGRNRKAAGCSGT